MEYNSFYGGRRGASFVIVERYKSIAEMVAAFSQGGDYKTVNYDEYVIIDTENKNDKDNGKVYRRGYNYANDPTGMAGAEYVGQIVGPAGLGPHLELNEYDEVHQMWEDAEGSPDDLDYRHDKGTLDLETKDLMPGAKGEPNERTFDDETDKIHWEYFSLRDEHQLESTCHLGFKVPYTIIDFYTDAVEPYNEEGNYADMSDAILQTEDPEHPFYEQWNLKIPKGVKGDMFKELRISTVGEEEEKHPGWLQAYVGEDDDRDTIEKIKERKILVYDYYHYDDKNSGEPVSFFLGDYNMIDDVNVDEYGTLTIDYSHDDEEIYKNIFKWVKEIRLNKETGLFEVEYNYDKTRDGEDKAKEDTKYQMYMTWVKDMAISEDGTISWTFTTPENDKTYYNFMKWIKEVQLDAENGLFSIDFNYETEPNYKPNAGQPTHYEQSLQWVKDIIIAKDGTVTFDYTNKEDTVYKNYIKWVKSIQLDPETGHMEVLYNYDEDEEGTPTKYEVDLRWLKELQIDDDGSVHLDYTYGDDKDYPKFFKFIKNVELDPATGHFKVEYNYDEDNDGNPTIYEQDLRWVNEVTIDEEGTIKFDYTNGEDTVYTKYLKSIKSVTLDSETGDFDIYYNHDQDAEGNDTHYHTTLKWAKSVEMGEDGTLQFHYTNGDTDTFKNALKTIKEVTLDPETGHFEVLYNYNTNEDGTSTKYEADLRWVKAMSINDEGTINLDYTNGEDKTYEKFLKFIKSVELDGNTGHLIVKYNYETNANGEPTTYETDLRYVNDIVFSEDGQMTLKYTHGDDKILGQKIRWISQVTVDEDGTFKVQYNNGTEDSFANIFKFISDISLTDEGHLTIEYNNGTPSFEKDLRWADDLTLKEDGSLTIIYNDKTEKELDQKIKWIVEFNTDETGKSVATWNDGTQTNISGVIKWLSDVQLKDNGEFQVTYNDDAGPKTLNTVKWLSSVDYDAAAAKLRFTFNNGDTQEYDYKYINSITMSDEGEVVVTDTAENELFRKTIEYPTKVEFDGHIFKIIANTGTELLNTEIKYPTDIDIVNDKFQITYNDETTKDLDLELNQIEDVQFPIDGEYAFHLLVKYTAASKQGEIEYNGKTGYVDLGVTKDYNGIMVGTYIDSAGHDFSSNAKIIEYLTQEYPNGITEGYAAGKIVTIGAENDNKKFFAFDYQNNKWFYLGDVNGISDYRSVVAGKENDEGTIEVANSLPTGSLWFIIEEE